MNGKQIETIDVMSLPYSERQLIVVNADRVVEASRAASRENVAGGPEDFTAAVNKALNTFLFPFGIFSTSIELVTAWARARKNGLNVLQIGQTESAQLQFPPGHPREQALYVAHPAKNGVYYTMAAFHRTSFEHKFSEAIRLLMSLGASEIEVAHVQGWDRNFAAGMSLDIKDSGLGVNGGKSNGSKSSLLFKASFDGSGAPHIPDGLVWLPHEPTWQALAEGRIQRGMNEFSLSVSYEDDFGVHAGMKTKAEKSGLEIGGKFEDHLATTWRLEGKFHSRS